MAVVVPAFMSLKVVPVIVLGSPSVAVGLASIASVKVAVTLTPGAIIVELLAGLVLLTLGGVVSAGVSAQSGSVESPSVVSLLSAVCEVVCALAAPSSTSPAAKSIAPPLSPMVVAEAVLLGGGRVVGGAIAEIYG